MEVIEFLERTNHRNLYFNIDCMVKQKLKEYDDNLESRRKNLRDMLEYENLRYDEELILLMKQRIAESKSKRLEWIGIQRIEREKAIEELLKLKEMQRELENCEAIRILESKQILMETKQAQLYQIEEKKALRRKERHIEQMWLDALERLNDEKEKQEVYARKLCKVIADSDQLKNIAQNEELTSRQQIEAANFKDEQAKECARAWNIEKKYHEAERIREQCKKVHQSKVLRQQIEEQQQVVKQQIDFDKTDGIRSNIKEDVKIFEELNQHERQKIENNVWEEHYQAYAMSEKQEKRAEAKEFDDIFVGTGCVLHQQHKKPYGKSVR